MTASEEFIRSMCKDSIQVKIIEILNSKDLNDLQKMEILAKFIREIKKDDQI